MAQGVVRLIWLIPVGVTLLVISLRADGLIGGLLKFVSVALLAVAAVALLHRSFGTGED